MGVVGGDWPDEHTQLLEDRNVDTSGLVKVEDEQTFNWTGKYLPNMNDRETLDVNLNVFGKFDPVLPDSYKSTPYVFLANGMPAIQQKVLDQVDAPKLVVADTMDLWINEHRDSLLGLLTRIDGLVLNDSEAKLLTGHENLVTAAKAVLDFGVSFVVLKKGEHGALFVSADDTFILPAFPTGDVKDPTGAGDSFAGGMMGYLASVDDISKSALRKALVYGTLVASYNVEDFSLDKMRQIQRSDLDARYEQFQAMLAFD